jgi:arylsulfatase A-like enzyme
MPAANVLNILLISVDQWRGDLLGSAGHPFARTPNLDALAAAGTRFARHFCQAYPCGPARASLVTGLYAHKHRSIQNGVPLDARHATLFKETRKAGYRPRLFGYTDTTLDPRGRPDNDPDRGDYENVCPGLDVDTLLTERATAWIADLRGKGYDVDPDSGRNGVFAQSPYGAPAIFSAEDSETAFLTNRFLSWLSAAGSAPWFAYVSYVAPHPPFSAARPYHDLIDLADVTPPLRGRTPQVEAAQHPLVGHLFQRMDASDFIPGLTGMSSRMDEDTVRKIRAVYAGQASEVDHHVGRIVAALRAAGVADRTVIIFTSDHAEQLFDHWMLGKAGYFDQSAHIPLIVYDPRPEADGGRGATVTAFTESIDVMPTILALAGLPNPRNGDGLSLLPFCAGSPPADWRDEAHWSFDFRNIETRAMESAFGIPSDWCNLQVVRTDRLKYVHFAGLPPVLFDLADDPGELVNRADDPAARPLLMEGMERLLTWRQRHEERTLTGYLAHDGKWVGEA